MNISFRPTTIADVAEFPAIERSAGQRFRQIPELAWIADGPVISAEQHKHYVTHAISWLALVGNHPVGFLLAEAQNSELFIVEVSLHLDWQGQGIGRGLIAYASEQAREMGYRSLSLTTFRDVPWNAPWYRRMGFEMLPEASLPAALRQKITEEVAHGMTYESRCAMRLILS